MVPTDKADWLRLVQELEETMRQVEQDDKDLGDALQSAKHPELRQALKIAVGVLSDGRKLPSVAKTSGLDEEYLREHLLPLLREALDDA